MGVDGEDSVVLVTGAGRGIGEATARRLAARGFAVSLVDNDGDAVGRVAESIGDDRAIALVADVRDPAAMRATAEATVERLGGIDSVVANAGVASYGSLAATDPAAFARVLDVNVAGVFHTLQATLPHLARRKGYLLVVSSAAAYLSTPGLAAYGASKAAVEHLANTARIELASSGVTVGSAHMTWVDSDLIRDATSDMPSFGHLLAALGPFGRTTSVDDCADALSAAVLRRTRRVSVPRWSAGARWFRPLLASRPVERVVVPRTAALVAAMDVEVAALGRSASARTLAAEAVVGDAAASRTEPPARPRTIDDDPREGAHL